MSACTAAADYELDPRHCCVSILQTEYETGAGEKTGITGQEGIGD